MTDTTIVADLRTRIAGEVHAPGDAGYDTHRAALLPTLDPRPAAVVEAANAADVQAAVVLAQRHDLPFAVQATGHGTHVGSDGGVLVKTTSMNEVHVDAGRSVARVGPGALWGDVLDAAAVHGLVGLAGSSRTVGVTGFMLGGGMGWLSRRFGLGADSVLRAEVVTADGELVVADAGHHAELFWALRGGGASFGVVVALEFRLYPVTTTYGGISWYPIERAADVLPAYRDLAGSAPEALSTALVLARMPAAAHIPEDLRGTRAVGVKALYAGPADEARRLLRPVQEAAGPALVDGFTEQPFVAAAMGGTPSKYLDFFDALSDDVIEAIVAIGGSADPAAPTVEIRHWDGAITRGGAAAGPAGGRSAPFSVIVDTADPAVTADLRPHGREETFLNFLSDPSRVAAAFTPGDHARLRAVKASYDPRNVFRVNLNIEPARKPLLLDC